MSCDQKYSYFSLASNKQTNTTFRDFPPPFPDWQNIFFGFSWPGSSSLLVEVTSTPRPCAGSRLLALCCSPVWTMSSTPEESVVLLRGRLMNNYERDSQEISQSGGGAASVNRRASSVNATELSAFTFFHIQLTCSWASCPGPGGLEAPCSVAPPISVRTTGMTSMLKLSDWLEDKDRHTIPHQLPQDMLDPYSCTQTTYGSKWFFKRICGSTKDHHLLKNHLVIWGTFIGSLKNYLRKWLSQEPWFERFFVEPEMMP